MGWRVLFGRVASSVGVVCFFLVGASSPAWAAFTEQGLTVLGTANYDSRSASLADIDNDGDLDLLFQTTSSEQLWRNNKIESGTLTYTNISSSIPTTAGNGWSAAWGDYDGDGRIDVFVGSTNSGSETGDVLRNNMPTSFINTSVDVGLNDPSFHQNVAWNDIDNDNDLDLIIGMEGSATEKHQIYLQGAGHTFAAVGAAVGIQADFGYKAYGTAIGDYDEDGDNDIFISTCATFTIRDNFYKNMLKESGNGTLSFVDIAGNSPSDPLGNGTQSLDNSYGAEFVDFDNDGYLDLFVVGSDQQKSRIFRNQGPTGNFKFTDVDTITGHALLTDVGTDLNGGKAVDYDNDGDLDLFFHDHLSGPTARKLYCNDGNWQFTDVTVAEGINNTNQGAYDSVWGDIDLDGDQDLIAPTGGSPTTRERIFINDASTNGNHWLYVRLDGPEGNTTGIGASLYATLADGTPEEVTLRREANTNAGTFNQSDLPVHFGLGAASSVDQLLIRWPDGSKQVLLNVAADQYMTIQYMPGDYNGDGVVDTADYVNWRAGMGTLYTVNDYNVWLAHFGQSIGPGSGSTSAAVPEPAGLTLLLAGILAACGRRRRIAPRRKLSD